MLDNIPNLAALRRCRGHFRPKRPTMRQSGAFCGLARGQPSAFGQKNRRRC